MTPLRPAPMARTFTARASGKVNLQLSVGERREDGYHPLVTVFQAVSLYETVSATARSDEQITLTVSAIEGYPSDLDQVPLDGRNLAWRAADALRAAFGITEGVDLSFVKGVPTAGGMAGGSADAAAALLACSHAWDLGLSREQLMDVGATLGADVPFSVLGHTAVGLGRGDELSPAMARGEFHWVFATQATGLSTPAVFAAFDDALDQGRRVAGVNGVNPEVMTALMAGDAQALGAALSNDLHDAALDLMPHLERVFDAAEEAEALGTVLSGSGPTVAALAVSKQHALAIASHLRATGVATSVITASGPAPGAVVVEGQ